MKKDLITLKKLFEEFDYEKITENFEIVTRVDRELKNVYNCAVLENGEEVFYESTKLKVERCASDGFVVKIEALPDFVDDFEGKQDYYLLSVEEAVQLHNQEVLEKQIGFVEEYLEGETDKQAIAELEKEIEDLEYYFKKACESAINSF